MNFQPYLKPSSLWLGLFLLASVALSRAQTPSVSPFDARPWLEDRYVFTESCDTAREGVLAQTGGAYGIGNGRAFALIGLATPLWTWSNLYGASYQEPSLGSLKMTVRTSKGEYRFPDNRSDGSVGPGRFGFQRAATGFRWIRWISPPRRPIPPAGTTRRFWCVSFGFVIPGGKPFRTSP